MSDTQEIKDRDRKLIKQRKFMECTALRFMHDFKNFELDGCIIGDVKLGINYDRTGNILLGMDILKDWDIHIGTISTGETIFLACPKDRINDEYLLELEKLFGIGTAINKSLAR